MGTASIVFGLIGLCICWIPGWGWLGAFSALMACVLGVPSITHWFRRPGYGPWGISGLILGVTDANLSLAYQIKYAHGTLDAFVIALSPLFTAVLFVLFAALSAAGLVIARTKNRPAGIVVTASALSALILVGTWGLVTADRQYDAAADVLSAK